MMKSKLCTVLFLTVVCFGLASPAQSEEIKATQVVPRIHGLSTGDFVFIRHRERYLRCVDGKNCNFREITPETNLNEILFKGTKTGGKYQFSCMDSGGPAVTFLYQSDAKRLRCSTYNGTGSRTKWYRNENPYSSLSDPTELIEELEGYVTYTILSRLKNNYNGRCMHVHSGNWSITFNNCEDVWEQLFYFEKVIFDTNL